MEQKYKCPNTHNIGIQMKRTELIKIFLMIFNWKNPLGSTVYLIIFQRCKGYLINVHYVHMYSYVRLMI